MAQGRIRYRCFLPDLTEFTVPPCTGPNYQQSTSPACGDSLQQPSARRGFLLAEREGFEPSVPLLGVHTISNRAPSTARSPLPIGNSTTGTPSLLYQRPMPQKISLESDFAVFFLNVSQEIIRGKDQMKIGESYTIGIL